MAKWKSPLIVFGLILFPLVGNSWGQTIPVAPPVPTCSWDGSGTLSTCKFKDAMAGTATSVVGNRVIVFSRSASGSHGTSRTNLKDAVDRLATRYGFTVTVSEDPTVFTAENLSDAKVVIMSNGDGDVVPPGANRTALENFQQVNGWGLIWIHKACSFISSGWPFGQQSCVQQYFHHNPSGTKRRVFIDSGTSAIPNQGRKNPQSEFLLRQLPGWGGNLALEMSDEWHCFRAPARNSAGVNVLFGYDRSSGLPDGGCPSPADSSEAGSQRHNLAWTHSMGQGITIINSWGHNPEVYTESGNMGDSLLWRYIRYAAKDWCVSGSGDPGCDGPASLIQNAGKGGEFMADGSNLSLKLNNSGPHRITVHDLAGKKVFSTSHQGPGPAKIPGLRSGIWFIKITSGRRSEMRKFLLP